MKNRRERKPANWVRRVEYDERKCIVKTAKFSLVELEEAYSRQRKAGYKSFSAFLRDCVLNTEIVERVTPEQLRLISEMQDLETISIRLPEPATWGNVISWLMPLCD